MGRFSKQLKRIANYSNDANYSNKKKNKSLESLAPTGKVIFFGGYEGSNEQIPYSYYELQNIFNQTTDEEAVRFYHEAKKYGQIKFIKEIDNDRKE